MASRDGGRSVCDHHTTSQAKLTDFDWIIALVSSSMFILVLLRQLPSYLAKRMLRLEVCCRLALRSVSVLPLLSLLVLPHQEGKSLWRSLVITV